MPRLVPVLPGSGGWRSPRRGRGAEPPEQAACYPSPALPGSGVIPCRVLVRLSVLLQGSPPRRLLSLWCGHSVIVPRSGDQKTARCFPCETLLTKAASKFRKFTICHPESKPQPNPAPKTPSESAKTSPLARRKPIPLQCAACGAGLLRGVRGPIPTYCGPACRMSAMRERKRVLRVSSLPPSDAPPSKAFAARDERGVAIRVKVARKRAKRA